MLLPGMVGPRAISSSRNVRATLIVYSDASYEPVDAHPAKLGLIVFSERRSAPLGLAASMPQAEMMCLKSRKQRITRCQMLPAFYFPLTHSELVEHADIIWFIDNQAAASAFIKGASSEPDLAGIAAAIHLQFTKLSCRLWI